MFIHQCLSQSQHWPRVQVNFFLQLIITNPLTFSGILRQYIEICNCGFHQAIERRRARLGEVEGPHMESPMSQDRRVVDSPEPLSGAQLEHNTSVLSPIPTFHEKHCPPSVGKVPKILLDITNQAGGELEPLTPQRKLLNSIDKVEKVVMEELNKLKRTPSARKAERDKRVRTLMSMR